MRECTGTDKPLVSIVMATYNPRLDWLEEQLVSLENQTYRPLELFILDDCSTKVELEEIRSCVADCIRSIPYQIMQNEVNLGSTKTFEKLTMLAEGEFIAYCDQDDVWHREKIETLSELFTENRINLVYSDVQVIDSSGNRIADSITEFRTRHHLYEGNNLFEKLIIQNFVIGCTMIIKKKTAQGAVPFIQDMVHDHYMALTASLDGELRLCKKSLVFYRVHENNQTNTLTQISSKKDYYNYKIKPFLNRMIQLEGKRLNEKLPQYSDIRKWAEARTSYYNGDKSSAKYIWRYRKFDTNISLFELIMLKMPNPIFKYALNMIKKGKI